MRVDYALQQLKEWYVGDGMYSDGPSYAYDYYNRFVIRPFVATSTDVASKKTNAYNNMITKIKMRNERYAILQERLVNTDGTYPATGRSLVYRGVVFQHLADMAWRKALPAALKPAQVRCALTAVIKKTLESSTISGAGSPSGYTVRSPTWPIFINQGSLYLATTIFLPPGLPASDSFWADAPENGALKGAGVVTIFRTITVWIYTNER